MRPSRAASLLAVVALLALGTGFLVMNYLGTFDTQSCAPPPPAICWENPNPWPGYLGLALWAAGLGVAAAAVLQKPLKWRRQVPPTAPSKDASGSVEEKAQPSPEPRKEAPPNSGTASTEKEREK